MVVVVHPLGTAVVQNFEPSGTRPSDTCSVAVLVGRQDTPGNPLAVLSGNQSAVQLDTMDNLMPDSGIPVHRPMADSQHEPIDQQVHSDHYHHRSHRFLQVLILDLWSFS